MPKTSLAALLACNERGANLWTRDDGRVHFVKSLGEGRWLSICYTPDNYPSFEVALLQMSAKELATGLSKSYKGDQIQVMKMNDFTPMLDTNFRVKKFVVTKH